MKTHLLGALLFISGSLPAQEVHPKEKARLTAILEMRTAYQLKGNKFQKIELYGRPELDIPLSHNMRIKAIGRIYAEVLDNLEPGKPSQAEVSRFSRRAFAGKALEMELRELYYDWKIKNHYLTIGKQQIVWGKTDGLKLLDVVNPTNLREFLLDDFDNSRIPLWSVKADIALGKIKTQLVWIPDQTYHDLPDRNSAFFPSAFFPQPGEGLPVEVKPLEKPAHNIKNSDAGMRISGFIKGWDVTLNYFYHFDDFPVIHAVSGPSALALTPIYKRHHLAGGTFSNSFGKVTMRGEIAYAFGKYFSLAGKLPGTQGNFRSDQFMSGLGMDYSGISNTLISVQWFEDYILKNRPVPGRDRLESNLSLLVNRNFKNETITLEVIAVQNLNKGDGFIRPKLKYQLRSNIILSSGIDLFYGSRQRLFGQFKDLNRIGLGIQWGL